MLRFFDKHSWFRGPNETFSMVQSTQLSGKLSRLKNKHARKNVHAKRLNANGSSPIPVKGPAYFRRVSCGSTLHFSAVNGIFLLE